MLKKKQGLPEDSELVLCTVTKVYPHCVFVTMDEYSKSGMIHISEISPGRIRNIRDYVVEGKKVICKVLRIDQTRGNVDLSLRRVSEAQKKEKAEEMKQEQMAEKIVEFVASRTKNKTAELYKLILDKAGKDYDSLYEVFEEFIVDDSVVKGMGLSADVFKELDETIRQRIKPPRVEITGELSLKSYAPDGVEIIKEALMRADKASENVSVSYKGAGKYKVEVVDDNYKDAEKKLKSAVDAALEYVEQHGGEADFERAES